jgi:hypothetical protein
MRAKITDIENRVARLPERSRAELVVEWERLFGRAAPHHISHPLLVRSIAWKLQEQAFGGLSKADQKLLDRMAKEFIRDPSILKPFLQIKTGTRLRRLWQGKIHEVTATQDGFIYDGNKYRSLSEVARLITGTRWNGLVFFGLKRISRIKTRDSDNQATV